jgi:hypothetical protein
VLSDEPIFSGFAVDGTLVEEGRAIWLQSDDERICVSDSAFAPSLSGPIVTLPNGRNTTRPPFFVEPPEEERTAPGWMAWYAAIRG